MEENNIKYIKYYVFSTIGVKKVEAWFSPDGGQNWSSWLGGNIYDDHPHSVRDSIKWKITQEPTFHGRVKIILIHANNYMSEYISQYDFTILPAKPTNLSANSSYPYNSVILIWNDNSNYEEGYEIWRKGINENWHCISTYPSQGQGTGQIQWTDNSVSQFKDYFYKVRAYKDGIYSNFSDSVWVTTSPVIATKNVNLCLSSGKNIIRVGNTIHIVYSKDGKIYYRYSNDNGLSWSTPDKPHQALTFFHLLNTL
ncbi:MAG: hypothetical protein ABIM29_01545 [candidate division WOR-3 bacterium]